MKWLRRIWGAAKFAVSALVHEWRHGPGSTFAAPGAEVAGPGSTPQPTLGEFMSEMRALLEERPVAPVQLGPVVPEASVTAPVAVVGLSRIPHPPLDLSELEFYYVQTYMDGDPVAAHNGGTGREYRKCIEGLRKEGVVFHAWMNREPHDWGPR